MALLRASLANSKSTSNDIQIHMKAGRSKAEQADLHETAAGHVRAGMLAWVSNHPYAWTFVNNKATSLFELSRRLLHASLSHASGDAQDAAKVARCSRRLRYPWRVYPWRTDVSLSLLLAQFKVFKWHRRCPWPATASQRKSVAIAKSALMISPRLILVGHHVVQIGMPDVEVNSVIREGQAHVHASCPKSRTVHHT